MSEKKFEPYQKVLVRISGRWNADFFSHLEEGAYMTCGGGAFNEDTCIPYEGNEYLLGKTDDPKPKWEPRPGGVVAMQDHSGDWHPVIFMLKGDDGRYYYKYTAHSLTNHCCDKVEPLHKHFNMPEAE